MPDKTKSNTGLVMTLDRIKNQKCERMRERIMIIKKSITLYTEDERPIRFSPAPREDGTWELVGKEVKEEVETPMPIGDDAHVVLTGEGEYEGIALRKMASPIVQYLKNNHHPHTAIIITERRVMVVETIHSIPNN